MGSGGISFQHLLCEFTQIFPNTVAFTGQWPGYARGFEDTFTVEEVGATRYIRLGEAENGYAMGFSYASPLIASRLLRFRPQIIFANAFTIWTVIALLLKPLGRWKVIITYEGGSLTYENQSSTIRHQARRLMSSLADAFVVNSHSGKDYLLNILYANPDQVFYRPFLVPSIKALLQYSEAEAPQLDYSYRKRPIFLCVGQVVPRKGVANLINACMQLRQQGCDDYTVMIVGDGEQRPELETTVQSAGLEEQIIWVGKIPYHRLGAYFKLADVFVFPTYDDIWGMVLVEAMGFGKAVLCSQDAGAVEMVIEEGNGFIFDPHNTQALTSLMSRFISDPELTKSMGKKSEEIMSKHTPKEAIKGFVKAIKYVNNRTGKQ